MSVLMATTPSYESADQCLEQAARGSLDALNALVMIAMDAGTAGEVERFEALVAAGVYVRLAAAIGGPEEKCAYGIVLQALGDAYQAAGDLARAERLHTEALVPLRSAADAGHDEAAKLLSAAGPVWPALSPDLVALSEAVEDTIRDAARGCPIAIGAAVAGSLMNYTADTVPLQNLIEAEQYARLGAASGNTDLVYRLANVLLVRASYDRATGGRRALIAAVEACELTFELIDAGISDAVPLRAFAENAPSEVFRHVPRLLAFVAMKGSA